MATIGTLFVKIAADTGALVNGINRAERDVKRFVGNVTRAAGALAGVFGFVTAAKQVADFVEGIHKGARENLKWAASLEATARQLDISTAAVQSLGFVAKQAGIEGETLNKGLEKIRENLSKFATGADSPVLKQFGLSAKEAREIAADLEKGLPKLADKLQGFDKASRVTIMEVLAGKQADELLPLLERGGDALRRQVQAAKEKVAIDERLVSLAAQYHAKLAELEAGPARQVQEIALNVSMRWVDILQHVGNTASKVESEVIPAYRRMFQIVQDIALAQAIGPQNFLDAVKKREEQLKALDAQRHAANVASSAPGKGDEPRRVDGGRSINTGTGAIDEFLKKILKLREEVAGLNHELNFDRASAQNVKALEEFARSANGARALNNQVREYSRLLKVQEGLRGKLAFKEIAEQNERLLQITNAEVAGSRELVAILQMRYALEDRLGRKLTEAETVRADEMARVRFQLQENARIAQRATQELEDVGQSAATTMLGNWREFFEEGKNGWQVLGNRALSVLEMISNKMMELAMNDLFRMLGMGGNGPGLGGIFKLFGIGGGAPSHGDIGAAFPNLTFGFADGGRPPVGVASWVGERGKELFVPDVPGTIVPNHMLGGSSVHLHGAPDSTVRLAQVEAMLQQLGHRVTTVDRSIEPRARGTVSDAMRRGGSFANTMGG